MNYAITLPHHLITEIAFGNKKFEIRTRVPRGLQQGSRLVVVEKGTHGKCVMQLYVTAVHCMDWLTAWSLWKDKAGICFDWYKDYVAHRRRMFWIEVRYEGAYDDGTYIKDFGVCHIPQWFSQVNKPNRLIINS